MEGIGRSQQSTHNQASRQDSTSSSTSADQSRSRGSSNVKLTEERKKEILKMLKMGLGSSKAAEVGSLKSIQELANKMNVAVTDIRKWLGITDSLDEAIAKSNDRVQSNRSSSVNLTEEKQFLQDLHSSNDAEVGSLKSIREGELENKMKVGPNEMTKWLGITDGDDLNEVFANSTIRLHYKGSSDVQITRDQKKVILEILKKGLGSSSGKEVGISNSVRKMAIEVEVAGFEMQKLLGVTEEFNEAVTNSNAKVAGFEFQIQKSGDKNAENPKIPLDNELPEEMTNVESDIQNSTEMLNDIENSESVEQEPQEDFGSESPIPMDIEEVYLVKSKPLDSDDDETSSLFVEEGGSRNFSPKNSRDFDEDSAWELETLGEHLNPKLFKDISSSQNAEIQTDICSLMDAETQTEDSELSLTRLLSKPIKRKSRIDQYFPVLKKVKKA